MTQTTRVPRHPHHLEGSHWTRLPEEPLGAPFRHFEVASHQKRRQTVRLRAVLRPATEVELPWRALRDRSRWLPGWVSVVADDVDAKDPNAGPG